MRHLEKVGQLFIVFKTYEGHAMIVLQEIEQNVGQVFNNKLYARKAIIHALKI